MKTCADCGEAKKPRQFYSHNYTKDGLRPKCKDCYAIEGKRWRQDNAERLLASHLKRAYGLSLEEYEEMIAAQGGLCFICGQLPDKERLTVDHCHDTGTVRRLLCDRCNRGLGQFKDDPTYLRKAAEYLEYFAPANQAS